MDFDFHQEQTLGDLVKELGPETKVYFALTQKHIEGIVLMKGINKNHPEFELMFKEDEENVKRMYAIFLCRVNLVVQLIGQGLDLEAVRNQLKRWGYLDNPNRLP